jgi:hypothetical protein
MTELNLHGHIHSSHYGPHHVLHVSLPEFSAPDCVPDQTPHHFVEFQMIGVEVEKRGSLRRAIVKGIHEACGLKMFYKKGKDLVGKVQESVRRRSPWIPKGLQEGIEF